MVDDLEVVCAFCVPSKADVPPVVDADTVLSFATAFERLQLVSRRHAKGRHFRGRVQLQQLAPRHALDLPKPNQGVAVEQRLRSAASEGTDHAQP